MPIAYIGIGSNLENPLDQVKSACQVLGNTEGIELKDVSHWYGNPAIGPEGQPDYVNGVAAIDTSLAPLELLDALQVIENSHGRVRSVRWGPRTLDLDILLIDEHVIDTERLVVPHPEMVRRAFVIKPLHDIAPLLTLPSGDSVSTLLQSLDLQHLVKLL